MTTLHPATYVPDVPILNTGAFGQGARAYRDGVALKDCPIERYTRQWNQWRSGWMAEYKKQEARETAGLAARSERIRTGDWK